jgi:two-component system sensor histidine kinase KdpD
LRKTTVERLIHEAKGFTLVILDTRKEEPSEIKTPEEAARTPAAAPSVPVSTGSPALSGFLSPERIVIWDRTVEKNTVLRTLAEAAVADGAEVDLNAVLRNIAKREEQGSTFLNEGVALPHARIEKLPRPVVAVGLTRKGVSDVSTDKPIENVFLILSPAEAPETQIQILGLVSRASRNRMLLQDLEACRTPEDVVNSFREWERQASSLSAAKDASR